MISSDVNPQMVAAMLATAGAMVMVVFLTCTLIVREVWA